MDIEPVFRRHSAEVYQAAGMVAGRADCSVEEAVKLMQDRADKDGVTLDEIANAVLDRSIRFE